MIPPISRSFEENLGHSEDYKQLTGRLSVVHAGKGFWTLRYAPLDKEDRYGGSVVLAPTTSMEGFKDGDLVLVHGEILDKGRASRHAGGPLYRASCILLQQRAERQ